MLNRVKVTEQRRAMDSGTDSSSSSDEEGLCTKRMKIKTVVSRNKKSVHLTQAERNRKYKWEHRLITDEMRDIKEREDRAIWKWENRLIVDEDTYDNNEDEPIRMRASIAREHSSEDGGAQLVVREGLLAASGGSQLTKDLANEERPDRAFTTPNAKKSGLANACSGRIFVTTPKHYFGPITADFDPVRGTGVRVGEHWPDRLTCRQWGAHSPHVAGIAGQANVGAQSIALSGGYEDDEDHGWYFIYTGSGGRDLSGNKRTNKEQSKEQVFEKYNLALKLSCAEGYPVRVVRSHKERNSAFAPKQKMVRYDGIYRVEKCWRKRGKQKSIMCRFLFVRCDNERAPWESDDNCDSSADESSDDELSDDGSSNDESSDDENDPRNRVIPEIAELHGAQDIFERSKRPAWDWLKKEKRWGWTRPPPTSLLGAKHARGKRKRATVAPVSRIIPSSSSDNDSSQEEKGSSDDEDAERADVTLAIEAAPTASDMLLPPDSRSGDVSASSPVEVGGEGEENGAVARGTNDVSEEEGDDVGAAAKRKADGVSETRKSEDDDVSGSRNEGNDVSENREEEGNDFSKSRSEGGADVSAAAGRDCAKRSTGADVRAEAERNSDDVGRSVETAGVGSINTENGATDDDDVDDDVEDDVDDDDADGDFMDSELEDPVVDREPWKEGRTESGDGVKTVDCGVLGPKLTPESVVKPALPTLLLEPRRLNFEVEKETGATGGGLPGVKKLCIGALPEEFTPGGGKLFASEKDVRENSPSASESERPQKRTRVGEMLEVFPRIRSGDRSPEPGVRKEPAQVESLRGHLDCRIELVSQKLEAAARKELLEERLREAEQKEQTLTEKLLESETRERGVEARETALREGLEKVESVLRERLRRDAKKRRAVEQKLRQCEKAPVVLKAQLGESEKARAALEARLEEAEKARSILEARLREGEKARAALGARLGEGEKARADLAARLQESEDSRKASEHRARETEARCAADVQARELLAINERRSWVEKVGFLFWTSDEVTRGASGSDLVAGAVNRAKDLEKLLDLDGEQGEVSGGRTGGVIDRARDRLLILNAEVQRSREEAAVLGGMLDQSERQNEQLCDELERVKDAERERELERAEEAEFASGELERARELARARKDGAGQEAGAKACSGLIHTNTNTSEAAALPGTAPVTCGAADVALETGLARTSLDLPAAAMTCDGPVHTDTHSTKAAALSEAAAACFAADVATTWARSSLLVPGPFPGGDNTITGVRTPGLKSRAPTSAGCLRSTWVWEEKQEDVPISQLFSQKRRARR